MTKPRKSNPFKTAFIGLLIVGAAGLCYVFSGDDKGAAQHANGSKTNHFVADEPLRNTPEELIPGLILLTADQMTRIPLADGFQWPVGTPTMGMMYDAQPFGAPNPKRGGNHSGQDLNGIGGQNTDEGEPVRAAARGLVIYSGQPHEGWGNIVVIAHRLPDSGKIIQTLYAHLHERKVRPGQLVSRGQLIGTIGTANGNYLAHLHFEAIPSLSQEAGMPAYHPAGTMNRMNPAELIATYPAPAGTDPYEQVRRLLIRETANATPTSATSSEPSAPGTINLTPSQFLKQ